jgi:Domain of unknown function (DUF4281)
MTMATEALATLTATAAPLATTTAATTTGALLSTLSSSAVVVATSSTAIPPPLLVSPEPIHTAFTVATFFPQPFWLLMILFPNSKITKQIMGGLGTYTTTATKNIDEHHTVHKRLKNFAGSTIYMSS